MGWVSGQVSDIKAWLKLKLMIPSKGTRQQRTLKPDLNMYDHAVIWDNSLASGKVSMGVTGASDICKIKTGGWIQAQAPRSNIFLEFSE